MAESVPIPTSWFTPGETLHVQRSQRSGLCEVPDCLFLSFVEAVTSEGHRLICLSHYDLAMEGSRRPGGQPHN